MWYYKVWWGHKETKKKLNSWHSMRRSPRYHQLQSWESSADNTVPCFSHPVVPIIWTSFTTVSYLSGVGCKLSVLALTGPVTTVLEHFWVMLPGPYDNDAKRCLAPCAQNGCKRWLDFARHLSSWSSFIQWYFPMVSEVSCATAKTSSMIKVAAWNSSSCFTSLKE